MRLLLVSYYWYPWNTSGAFRWLHLSEFIDIATVFTSKRPCKGFFDETMPKGRTKFIIRMFQLPAALWGFAITPIVFAMSFFYDKIIFTITPESLLFPAWILQICGKVVYVDMRDKIDRHTQPHKWLVPIYQRLYKRIKNVCVTMQCFDETKPVIRQGYDVSNKFYVPWQELILNYNNRISYSKYCQLLIDGHGRDFGEGFDHYTSSSVVTLRHLGNPIKGNLHPELFEFEPQSWEEISKEMSKFLGIS
ncbi:MAG: hypothetical protein ACFFDN_10855 [Candidatus Hodarchaeota archaeon]